LIIDKYSREVAKESGVAPVIGRDADALAQLSYNLYRDSV
jgi:hypothetical protein